MLRPIFRGVCVVKTCTAVDVVAKLPLESVDREHTRQHVSQNTSLSVNGIFFCRLKEAPTPILAVPILAVITLAYILPRRLPGWYRTIHVSPNKAALSVC